MTMPGSGGRAGGFTLIEMVTVLTLVGALAAIAAPRFADPSPFQVRGFYDEAMAAARYAQKIAIASGCKVRMQFNAGYSAFIACNGGAEVALSRPGSSDLLSASAPNGVTVTNTSITFDKMGRPIAISAGNTVAVAAWSFTVETETGLVH